MSSTPEAHVVFYVDAVGHDLIIECPNNNKGNIPMTPCQLSSPSHASLKY